jgi:hypothetical protein
MLSACQQRPSRLRPSLGRSTAGVRVTCSSALHRLRGSWRPISSRPGGWNLPARRRAPTHVYSLIPPPPGDPYASAHESDPTPLLDAVADRGSRSYETPLHFPGHKVGWQERSSEQQERVCQFVTLYDMVHVHVAYGYHSVAWGCCHCSSCVVAVCMLAACHPKGHARCRGRAAAGEATAPHRGVNLLQELFGASLNGAAEGGCFHGVVPYLNIALGSSSRYAGGKLRQPRCRSRWYACHGVCLWCNWHPAAHLTCLWCACCAAAAAAVLQRGQGMPKKMQQLLGTAPGPLQFDLTELEGEGTSSTVLGQHTAVQIGGQHTAVQIGGQHTAVQSWASTQQYKSGGSTQQYSPGPAHSSTNRGAAHSSTVVGQHTAVQIGGQHAAVQSWASTQQCKSGPAHSSPADATPGSCISALLLA